MIRALSTAATGMEAQQTRLDVTANNMANVSTTGFKKSRAEFQDLMYQTLRAPGGATGTNSVNPTGVQVGMGVRTVATQRMHTQGTPVQTGNALDVAIEGPGFFRLTMPTGELAYTRDGSFKRDTEGRLVNADGYPLDADIQIPADAEGIIIGADGLVTAKLPGNNTPVELGQIELSNFANPAGLSANGRNLYFETASSGNPVSGAPGEEGVGTLAQNQLESSNVQIVEEMIDLISGQRAYEINSRVIRAADEMLQQTANLK
ncbi:MAG: flagellar basal-body rod protein FlgG [Deltaproteobacteria bacterium]|nr:flagellar basal-body rod protein FlgG [Deltaproteobacteria bacterium]